jgi:hypothetical protein
MSFPYVCPEPVLVKMSHLYINGLKRPVFAPNRGIGDSSAGTEHCHCHHLPPPPPMTGGRPTSSHRSELGRRRFATSMTGLQRCRNREEATTDAIRNNTAERRQKKKQLVRATPSHPVAGTETCRTGERETSDAMQRPGHAEVTIIYIYSYMITSAYIYII